MQSRYLPVTPSRTNVVQILMLASALGFAAFAATRSDGLARAGALFQRSRDPRSLAHVARLSLDQLDRQPWNREAALQAALALSLLDQPGMAEPYYARGGPRNQADAHTRAYAILRSNMRERAIDAYLGILKRWPNDAQALRLLGGIYYSQRQYEQALDCARRLAPLPEGAVAGHQLAGSALHETGDYAEAVSEFEQVLELDPKLTRLADEARPVFWYRLGTDLVAIGQSRRAVDYLTTVMKYGEHSVLTAVLGQAYHQLGELDDAEACWRRAIAADPNLAIAWLELGRLELTRDNIEAAIVLLEKARSLAPDDQQVQFSLRNAYRRAGRTRESEAIDAHLEQLRNIQPARATGMGQSR